MRNYTDLSMLIDASGSMATLKNDTIGSFNGFVQAQLQIGDNADISLSSFNNVYNEIYVAKTLSEAPVLTSNEYICNGFTALFDSLATLIKNTGIRLESLPEDTRPDKVVIITITDGLENASNYTNMQQLKNLITHHQNTYNWQFVYLGANHDSFLASRRLGMSGQSVANYAPSSAGINKVYSDISSAVRGYRIGETKDVIMENTNK